MESSINKSGTKNELVKKLKAIDHAVFIKFQIEFVYLGGSWATETNDWWSDIDIFVSKPDISKLNSNEKINFLLEFSDILTKSTQFNNFQVSIFQNLPLHIQFSVINEGLVVYESSLIDRLNYIENLLNRYYDHQIWYNRMLNDSLGI